MYSGPHPTLGILGNFGKAGMLLWPYCSYLTSIRMSLALANSVTRMDA